MTIETFIEKRFSAASEQIIERAQQVASSYAAQGYDLTLRQLYYQFVSRGWLDNNDANYRRLGSVISDARLAGRLSWSYIQDRGRNVSGSFGGYDHPTELMEGMADRYIEAIWEGQEYRPEVWVEKEALIDVVSRAARSYRVPSFACKGYVSQSEMYEAAKRFERRRDRGLIPLVIHLGDHDPRGLDMTRDIRDRLALMSWGDVEVRRIALNMDQIEQHQPPPNPAKLSDALGQRYVDEYGPSSWELDALDPATLTELITDEIAGLIDHDTMQAALDHEAANEQSIRDVVQHWDLLTERWGEVSELLGVE